MRVPSAGQPLYERRIVREGKLIAECMLAGHAVTANGRFVREADPPLARLAARLTALGDAASNVYSRLGRAWK